jgi:hypothetical protein
LLGAHNPARGDHTTFVDKKCKRRGEDFKTFGQVETLLDRYKAARADLS